VVFAVGPSGGAVVAGLFVLLGSLQPTKTPAEQAASKPHSTLVFKLMMAP
jgi:hypothetical protein